MSTRLWRLVINVTAFAYFDATHQQQMSCGGGPVAEFTVSFYFDVSTWSAIGNCTSISVLWILSQKNIRWNPDLRRIFSDFGVHFWNLEFQFLKMVQSKSNKKCRTLFKIIMGFAVHSRLYNWPPINIKSQFLILLCRAQQRPELNDFIVFRGKLVSREWLLRSNVLD